jgi:tRNA(fMet)-specific endonuclease VapC
MTGKVFLDTNIVITLFAEDQAVLDKLAQTDEAFIPSIVLGELYFACP